jgi:hypothetical protein
VVGRPRTIDEAMERVEVGDRFELRRDLEVQVTAIHYAPSHTIGASGCLPAGTVVVACNADEGRERFRAYPEEYAAMEEALLPEEIREGVRYVGKYGFMLPVAGIGDFLTPLRPLDPRPDAGLPLLSGRPSERQRRGMDRLSAIEEQLRAALEDVVVSIADGAWARRNSGTDGIPAANQPSSPRSWDVWFDTPPGDPPREPDGLKRIAMAPPGYRGSSGNGPADSILTPDPSDRAAAFSPVRHSRRVGLTRLGRLAAGGNQTRGRWPRSGASDHAP